jgi:hypothetical protein
MFGHNLSQPSPNQHLFSRVPHADIPRSVFNRSHSIKTTFDGAYLYPIYVDEALPGDTFNLTMSTVIRFTTLLNPVMDNITADFFFFAVPNRLLWTNWQAFMGEHDEAGYQDTDYLVPVVQDGGSGFAEESIYDYMGIPIGVTGLDPNSLHLRAYNLIYNEWFRDQNLIDKVDVPVDDGPDAMGDFALLKRGKRHDYFTSALPWPQKGVAVDLPLGTTAPVITGSERTFGTAEDALKMWVAASGSHPGTTQGLAINTGGSVGLDGNSESLGNTLSPSNLYADLSSATAATINSLREAFQLQKMMEREALGGTRYIEIIKSHFSVTSPDHRLQRPEYLGGGSVPIRIDAIPVTAHGLPNYAGDLKAIGYSQQSGIGFTSSFTEHCVLLGLVNIRCDLTYQNGLNRMWSRQTKHDFYWPLLAHLGEQEVLCKELCADGVGDDSVFGYQERWAEYRYFPSLTTGMMRSDHSTPLDNWHLALDFGGTCPTLNQTFIEEAPPFDRIVTVTDESVFRMDAFFDIKAVRPMPLYSVPGMIDHF